MVNGIVYETGLESNITSRGPMRAKTLIETLLSREVFADEGQGLSCVSELDFNRVKKWTTDGFRVAGYYATLSAYYPAGTFLLGTNGRLIDTRGVMAARERFADTVEGLDGFVSKYELSDPELFITTAYIDPVRKIHASWSLDEVRTVPGRLMGIIAEMKEAGIIKDAYRPISGKVYTIRVTDDPIFLDAEFHAQHSRRLELVGHRLPGMVHAFNTLAPERAIEYSTAAGALRKAVETDRRFHVESMKNS